MLQQKEHEHVNVQVACWKLNNVNNVTQHALIAVQAQRGGSEGFAPAAGSRMMKIERIRDRKCGADLWNDFY